MENNGEKLAELAKELFLAKKAEDEAKKHRIGIEEKILALVDVGDNTSKTVKAGDLKLTVKRELGYAVDEEALFGAGLTSEWLEGVFDRVPETFKFNPRSYEKLHEANPEAYAAIAKYVATKPKKPSVSLKI